MSDIYHDPKAYGLQILAEDDCAGAYEFDKIVLFRRLRGGALFLGFDSGCSCPCPFEGQTFDDLVPATRERIKVWERENSGASAASVLSALRGEHRRACKAKVKE